MEEMNLTGCEAVVELRGYRRYMRHSIHRIYMEYCPYGDLRRLCKRYRGYRWVTRDPKPDGDIRSGHADQSVGNIFPNHFCGRYSTT